MGFFNKPETTPELTGAGPLPPLTRSRIEAFLTSQEWNYGIDSDGDVGGTWDDNVFYFFQMGDSDEILQVRGRWKHTFPRSREGELGIRVNEFNKNRIWPKMYTRVDGDEVAIYAEVSTDLEHGVNDDQLGQLIMCGLMSGLRSFESLAEDLGLAETTD